VLTDQVEHVFIVLNRHIVGQRVVRLEDITTAFGRVQLAQNDGFEFFLALVSPLEHVHVAAEGDAMAVFAAQVNDIQPSLSLSIESIRIVRNCMENDLWSGGLLTELQFFKIFLLYRGSPPNDPQLKSGRGPS